MEPDVYCKMFEVETTHWWYVGLHKLLIQLLRQHCDASDVLLDVGSGTGRWLEFAGQCGCRTMGLERNRQALDLAAGRGLRNLVCGEAEALPFPDGTVDVVTCIDVLYHVGVTSEGRALEEIRRVLRPGGLLVLQLPAFEWLRSSHDTATHGRRRYSRREVAALLNAADLQPIRVTYRNTLLFPLACAVRLSRRLLRAPGATQSDLNSPPALLNSLLQNVLCLENRLLSANISLPFGLSVLAVGRKT
ncbi:MAG: methyltransferase domain-containing protein [Lentisphaeria bacterium]|nr:methyltransferase domain-containing protein [Lentisphaeria bacterium]